MTLNTVRDVVEALGGRRTVAKAIGVTPEGVSNAIRRQSIPTTWHLWVYKSATERGLVVNPELFKQHRRY